MKKLLFIAATAAVALSSCSSENESASIVDNQQVNDGAVVFNAYQARNTRAGYTNPGDPIADLADLKEAGGFGVFGYEQGTAAYTTYSSNSSYPNFMYNQQVNTTDASANPVEWSYEPVKYFSNNPHAKHSFFAYAPYQETVKSIFALGNAPAIRYAAGVDTYDLMFAEAHMDMEKPGVTYRIPFNFQHALSQVNIYVAPFVDAVHVDGETPNHTTGSSIQDLDDHTTIYVRSIKFIGTVASQGLLSLEDGSWSFEATEESAYEINEDMDNNDIVLTTENTSATHPDQYKTVKTNMMVIPTLAGKPVQIQIVYDVVTVDPKNSVNNSTITNKIVSEEKFDLKQGVAYDFHLDLGMTSVKFDATVTDWNNPHKHIDVDLPNNVAYTLLTTKTLSDAILDHDIAAADFASSEVGAILIDKNLKAYECIKKAVTTAPTAPAEYKEVIYSYIYDSSNKKLYVYDVATAKYVEKEVKTTLTSLDKIDNTYTPGDYYLVDSNVYYVEWK